MLSKPKGIDVYMANPNPPNQFRAGNIVAKTHGAYSYLAAIREGREISDAARAVQAEVEADLAELGEAEVARQTGITLLTVARMLFGYMLTNEIAFWKGLSKFGYYSEAGVRCLMRAEELKRDDGATLADYEEILSESE
jgi:hypothetical protein